MPEWPGPSAPLAPNAGALWRELPFAVVGLVGLVLVAGGVPPELLAVVVLELVGALTVVGLGFEADAGAP